MLPAPITVRLRKHADYGLVYSASRKHHSASMSYFYRAQAELAQSSEAASPASRFGITVPRLLGNAVLRNRIKRRLRVVARTAIHLVPAGVDVVLHPRPLVATMPFPALEREIEQVFRTVAARVEAGATNTPLPRTPRRPGKTKSKAPTQQKAAVQAAPSSRQP